MTTNHHNITRYLIKIIIKKDRLKYPIYISHESSSLILALSAILVSENKKKVKLLHEPVYKMLYIILNSDRIRY